MGREHTLHDWTDGCIAVTNAEMDEIWKLVRVGTPIDISREATIASWFDYINRRSQLRIVLPIPTFRPHRGTSDMPSTLAITGCSGFSEADGQIG